MACRSLPLQHSFGGVRPNSHLLASNAVVLLVMVPWARARTRRLLHIVSFSFAATSHPILAPNTVASPSHPSRDNASCTHHIDVLHATSTSLHFAPVGRLILLILLTNPSPTASIAPRGLLKLISCAALLRLNSLTSVLLYSPPGPWNASASLK